MKNWLHGIFAPFIRPKPSAEPPRARLHVESLENRLVPTVTYHGGALLTHVEAQAVFLGSEWNTSKYAPQAATLDRFVKTIVNDSYMDMLTNAGYGVGRGTADPGRVLPVTLASQTELTDAAIQQYLQTSIKTGTLKPPDANRLYVIFIEENVGVRNDEGLISQTDFLGYHSAFAGRDAFGHVADIRYAVITYPGGTVGNVGINGTPTMDQLTEVASHEMAEAITDPDVNYSVIGWYDDSLNDEAGDVTNAQFVALDGFAMQRIADKNDQGMTPAGATPLTPASFVLLNDARLYEHKASGWTLLTAGVASVSDQGIDNRGHAMVDVVLASGLAYEYHDVTGWVYLDNGVKDAKAGQGVSYVLHKNGQLFEYRDAGRQWIGSLANDVASISAGTDRFGVSMVDAVSTSGRLSEYSDSTGWHSLCGNVQSVSAGSLGDSVVVLRDGRAFKYHEANGTYTFLAKGIALATVGVDTAGNTQIDLVSTSHVASELHIGMPAKIIANNVRQLTKPRSGLVGVIFSNGSASEHTVTGWKSLCGSAKQLA